MEILYIVAAGILTGLVFDLVALSVFVALLFLVALAICAKSGPWVATLEAVTLAAVLQVAYLAGLVGRLTLRPGLIESSEG